MRVIRELYILILIYKMLTIKSILKKTYLIYFLFILLSCNSFSEVKNKLILLKEHNLINETAEGKVYNLIDNNLSTKWFPGNKDIYYPAFCLIDLGCSYTVEKIRFHSDKNLSESKIEIFIGEPFNWKKLYDLNLSKVYNWTDYDTSVQTRFLRLRINASNTLINELKIYGDTDSLQCENIELPLTNNLQNSRKLVGEIIGINGFVDDPIDRYSPAGFIREYHSWNWTDSNSDTLKYPNNKVKFAKSYGYWDFDLYYENLVRQNIEVYPVIKENIKYLWKWDKNTKPIDPKFKSTNPEAYCAHADHLFQYAARYGKTKIKKDLLKIAEDQEPKSGLGYIEYYENWNEPDMWWGNKKHYFTPYEFAAMTSVDCDGHLGKFGTTIGLKNADRNAKLVLGGLAKLNIDYIKAIMFWSKFNRKDSLPFNVINFHHYSHNSEDLSANPLKSQRVGVSPEEDSLNIKISKIINFRDKYLPKTEVWITEFGYDTNPNSPHRADLINNFNTNEVQGIWLIRSYLELIAAGVDKAAMYMIRDTNNSTAKQFNTSGLTKSKKLKWEKKPSWYYLNTFKFWLKKMKFTSKEKINIEKVKCYKFTNEDTTEFAYVLWHFNSEKDTINYSLALNNHKYLKVIELTENDYGLEKNYNNLSSLDISITQKPTIVIIRDDNNFEKKQYIKLVKESEFKIDTVSFGNASLLFDEQNLKKPKTSWDTGFDRKKYPVFFTLNFYKTLKLNHINLYDTNSNGKLKFYYKIDGKWELLKEDELKYGNQWKTFVINKMISELKIEKTSPFANFSEIKIYKSIFYD